MDLHTGVEIVSAIVTFAGFVILLMVKNNQAEVKADLLTQINKTATELAVHTAQDTEKFKALDEHLDRIEDKVQYMGAKSRA